MSFSPSRIQKQRKQTTAQIKYTSESDVLRRLAKSESLKKFTLVKYLQVNTCNQKVPIWKFPLFTGIHRSASSACSTTYMATSTCTKGYPTRFTHFPTSVAISIRQPFGVTSSQRQTTTQSTKQWRIKL